MIRLAFLASVVVAAAAFVLPATASANTIVDSQEVTADGEGSVGYTYFTQEGEGATSFEVETTDPDFDPDLYLFHADPSDGWAMYSLTGTLGPVSLTAGDYVVAVGDSFLSRGEALAGINSNGSAASYSLHISSDATVGFTGQSPSPVPEPATLTLLGLGLAAVGISRRRRQLRDRREQAEAND